MSTVEQSGVVIPLLFEKLRLLLYNVEVDLVPVPVVYWVLIRHHSRAVVIGVVSFTGVAEFVQLCNTSSSLHLEIASTTVQHKRWLCFVSCCRLQVVGQTNSVELASNLCVEVTVDLKHTKPVGSIALSYQDVDRHHPRLLVFRGQSPQLWCPHCSCHHVCCLRGWHVAFSAVLVLPLSSPNERAASKFCPHVDVQGAFLQINCVEMKTK